jgi:hypothetical protein
MKQLKKKTSFGLSKTSRREVICQINQVEGKTEGNPRILLKTRVRVSDVFSSPAGTRRLVDLVSAFFGADA